MAIHLKKQHFEKTDWISWFAYYSSMQEAMTPPPAINAQLLLFLDSAFNKIVRAAVQQLNHGQVPIIVCTCQANAYTCNRVNST